MAASTAASRSGGISNFSSNSVIAWSIRGPWLALCQKRYKLYTPFQKRGTSHGNRKEGQANRHRRAQGSACQAGAPRRRQAACQAGEPARAQGGGGARKNA